MCRKSYNFRVNEPRILVADDDTDTVESLTVLLREEGYEVRGVHRGGEVLQAIFQFAPDVVLLDISMPQMTGYEVARALRERYGSARPTLIAVTGRAGLETAGRRRAAGFEHHVGQAVRAARAAAPHRRARRRCPPRAR